MQKQILHLGEDPDVKHRYQLFVQALGTFDELSRIGAELSVYGFEINSIDENTIEGVFQGEKAECYQQIRKLGNAGWEWQENYSI